MKSAEDLKSFGVGVVVLNEFRKVLLGWRCGTYFPDCWALPGGLAEPGESVIDCGIRELREETSLEAHGVPSVLHRFQNEDTSVCEETAGLLVEHFVGHPKAIELDKMINWRWFSLNKLPEPIFYPSAEILKNLLEPAR